MAINSGSGWTAQIKVGRKYLTQGGQFVKQNKFWINVARVDNAYGDRNLVTCLCDMG